MSFYSVFKMIIDDQNWLVLLHAHFPILLWMPTQTNMIRPEYLKIKFMSTLHWKYPIYYIFDIWWALENHPLPISFHPIPILSISYQKALEQKQSREFSMLVELNIKLDDKAI